MNKHRYRLVFNTARGLLMAVAEICTRQGKAAGETDSVSTRLSISTEGGEVRKVPRCNRLLPRSMSLWGYPLGVRNTMRGGLWMRTLPALLLSGALAGVGMQTAWSADAPLTPAGTAGQRPIMDAAPNGVPIVNIAPPSKGGVSRNQYQDFNVNARGLILNNSSGNSNTQLGGWIAGNPQLGPVSAKIIVNEVVGPNASQLRGVIEVGGKKADIVIANPNGLFCDGCGVLNSNRFTLTTGQPRYDASGNLTSLDVRQGLITVGQGGLTATNLGQLDLLARGIVLDGEVWAQNLNAIAGANQVLYGTLQQTSQDGTGDTPRFAVDIHDLGGMYANQVYLIATDKGLGVNSTGRMAATAGNLVLSANGDLTLKDTYASQNIDITNTGTTALTGQTQADGAININSQGALTHTGTMDAQSGLAVQANAISSSGSIANHASGELKLASNGTLTNSGIIGGADLVTLSGSSITDNGGTITSQQALNLNAHDIALNRSTLAANGNVGVTADTGNLNSSAAIQSGGDLNARAAGSLGNSGSASALGNASLQGNTVTNSGSVQTNGILTVSSNGAVTNDAGQLLAGQGLTVSGTQLGNHQGTLASNGDVTLTGTGLDNRNGVVSGAQSSVNLGTGQLDNTQGQVIGSQQLAVTASKIGNAGGTLASGADLTLNTAGQVLDNTNGQIVAQRNLVLNNAGLVNQGGTVAAIDGELNLDTHGNPFNNASGKLQAGGNTTITAGNTNNTAGLISGQDVSLQSGQFDNSAGQVIAGGKLDAQTAALNNDGGLLQSVGDLAVDTGSATLTNTHSGTTGGLVSGGALTIRSGAIDNTQGFIAAQNDASVNVAGQFNNQNGQLVGNGNTTVRAAELANGNGRIDTLGQLDVATTGSLDNSSGVMAAGGDAVLAVQTLNNHAGQIGARGITLNATTLDNSSGAIVANADATINADSIDNTAGQLGAQANLDVTAPALVNDQGSIGANGNVTVTTSADHLNGTIASQHDVTLNVNGDYTNAGTLTANENLTLNTRNLTNTGTLTAGDTLTANTGNLTNSGEIGANTTRIKATGTVTNMDTGLIDGYDTRIDAGDIENTGRIYGDWLSLGANGIHNSGPGVIAARTDLQIGAGTLTNEEGATVYSLGDVTVGGALDDNGWATGRMQTLDNNSATIEGVGQVNIASNQITQRDTHLTTHDEVYDSQDMVLIYPIDSRFGGIGYPTSRFAKIDTGGGHSQFIVHPEVYGQRQNIPPVYPDNMCGWIACTTQKPPNDTWDSPRFAQFGVDAPPPPPVKPSQCNFLNPRDPACVQYTKDDAAWQVLYTAALDALAPKVDAYNAQVTEDNRVDEFEDYKKATFTQVKTHTVVDNAGQPAQILSGGDLNLSGQVDNYDSQIVAGGALNIDGPTVNNVGRKGSDTTSYVNGLIYTHTVESCGTFGGSHCGSNSDKTPYIKAAEVTPIIVSTTVVIDHQDQTGARAIDPATGKPVAADPGTAAAAGGNSRKPGARVVDVVPVDGQLVVLFTPPKLNVPNSKLFPLHPEPGARYLVETDPAFTNKRNFLSSDYMLNALNRDPSYVLKRYGDGFFEQQMVHDQILALTGRRFIVGYQDTEAEYQALMESGVAFARQFQLTPGVALTAAQMAQLTTDIVWLEKRTVTLPDGSTQDVLVPQVYLRQARTGDLQTGGALMAGSDVSMTTTGQLTNSGRIQGDNVGLVAGTDLVNQNGRISGQSIYARANNDLKNLSGVILGSTPDSVVTLSAGRDIVLQTQTTHSTNADNTSSRDTVGHIATVQSGDVRLDAGRDLNVQGATVSATSGDLIATAGRDIKVTTAEGRYQMDSVETGGYHTQGRANELHESSLTNQGSSLSAAGNVVLVAKGDTSLTGADVHADGAVLLQGQNVTVSAAKDRQSNDLQGVGKHEYTHVASDNESASGGSVTAGGNVTLRANGDATTGNGNVNLTGAYVSSDTGQASLIANNNVNVDALHTSHITTTESYYSGGTALTKTTTTDASHNSWTQSSGSAVTGDTVLIQAGDKSKGIGDVTITGSQVVADRGLQMTAGHDLTITTSQDTAQSTSTHETKTSGLYSNGGASFTVGNRTVDQDKQGSSLTNTGSTVGSLSGDASLSAGNAYVQTGSTVNALKGDVDITGKTVDINNATDTTHNAQQDRMHQSGLTVAVSSPIIALAQTGQQMVTAASETHDARLQAMAAATMGLAAANTANAVAADPKSGGGISVSITVGGAKSENLQTQDSTTAIGSKVSAGGNVSIRAEGGGKNGSHLNVVGSDITAGGDTLLKSEGDITLQAAQNTYEQHSKNSSQSGGVGVAISYGSNGMAFGVTANAAVGRGNADGKDVSWSNSHVNAGNTLTIESGGDTNLKGATASGKQVVADVGGNLNIESLQDTSTYKSKDQSLSGSVTVGYGFSASAAASQQKMDADFASVTEQSGIKAGDGGYHINVNGNTDLKGAVIASTDAAVKDGLNSLTTDTLTTREIKNHAEYHASSISLSGGYTSSDYSQVKADGSRATPVNTPTQGVGTDQQGNAATAGQTPGTRLPSTGANGTGASVAPPTVMAASDSDSSVTRSGISGGTVTIKNSDKQQALTGKTADDTVASLNRDVSSDKDTSNHIDNNFNKQEIQTAFDITAAFQRETGTWLNNKAKDAQAAQKALDEESHKPLDQQDPYKIAALQQQVIDTAKWAPGGEYRQVITAIVAASGGNVTGGSTQLIESAAASYIQSLGTEQIKHIADGIGKGTPEAETARAALQALVACGGAAASGLNCGAAATSAATSAVLNALLDKTTGDAQDLTPEQKEMRANLVESLISGIAATAGVNGDLGSVKSAAQIETENNALKHEDKLRQRIEDVQAKNKTVAKYSEDDIVKAAKNVYGRDDMRTFSSEAEAKAAIGERGTTYYQNASGQYVERYDVPPELEAIARNLVDNAMHDGGSQYASLTKDNFDQLTRKLVEAVGTDAVANGATFAGAGAIGGIGSTKFPSKEQLAKMLGTTVDDFHTILKKGMKDELKAEMKQIGATNPDIGINGEGNIVLKNPKTGKTIDTDLPLSYFGK